MRYFFFFISLFLSSSSFAHFRVILNYHYGNQITQSTLIVTEEGRIFHTERTCCAPKEVKTEEAPLSDENLAILNKKIAAAGQVEPIISEGHPTLNGSSSGELVAYLLTGEQIQLHTIERNKDNLNDIVTRNPSAEALGLEQFVLKYVKAKMYQ